MSPAVMTLAAHHKELHGLIAGSCLKLEIPCVVSATLPACERTLIFELLVLKRPISLTSLHRLSPHLLSLRLLCHGGHGLCWKARQGLNRYCTRAQGVFELRALSAQIEDQRSDLSTVARARRQVLEEHRLRRLRQLRGCVISAQGLGQTPAHCLAVFATYAALHCCRCGRTLFTWFCICRSRGSEFCNRHRVWYLCGRCHCFSSTSKAATASSAPCIAAASSTTCGC
mmetsp:Transcript_84565/g.149666  ORF Transcript_84565/g.149666 Transcript_84565/m.149666 type:complete len:228 (+) Transcript_84565:173-856(+)